MIRKEINPELILIDGESMIVRRASPGSKSKLTQDKAIGAGGNRCNTAEWRQTFRQQIIAQRNRGNQGESEFTLISQAELIGYLQSKVVNIMLKINSIRS